MPEQQTRLLADRYELTAPIGRGTMGTVWRAWDRSLGRAVAIKEIRHDPRLTDEQRTELRERLIREGRIAARLNHPSVAMIHDAIVADDSPWIIMELVAGRSLEQVIDEEGPLPPRLVAEIGLDLLSALRAAHDQGILHRDVKPSNVLLTDSGRVVLTDFGIAKAVGDDDLTKTGMVIGSPGYTAPERARGDYAGPESDLWSLGATLYFAAEGNPAFERGSVAATLSALMTQEPNPPTQAGPLRPVLDGLLLKDYTRRLNAATTATMLRAIAKGSMSAQATATRPATPPDQGHGPGRPDHGHGQGSGHDESDHTVMVARPRGGLRIPGMPPAPSGPATPGPSRPATPASATGATGADDPGRPSRGHRQQDDPRRAGQDAWSGQDVWASGGQGAGDPRRSGRDGTSSGGQDVWSSGGASGRSPGRHGETGHEEPGYGEASYQASYEEAPGSGRPQSYGPEGASGPGGPAPSWPAPPEAFEPDPPARSSGPPGPGYGPPPGPGYGPPSGPGYGPPSGPSGAPGPEPSWPAPPEALESGPQGRPGSRDSGMGSPGSSWPTPPDALGSGPQGYPGGPGGAGAPHGYAPAFDSAPQGHPGPSWPGAAGPTPAGDPGDPGRQGGPGGPGHNGPRPGGPDQGRSPGHAGSAHAGPGHAGPGQGGPGQGGPGQGAPGQAGGASYPGGASGAAGQGGRSGESGGPDDDELSPGLATGIFQISGPPKPPQSRVESRTGMLVLVGVAVVGLIAIIVLVASAMSSSGDAAMPAGTTSSLGAQQAKATTTAKASAKASAKATASAGATGAVPATPVVNVSTGASAAPAMSRFTVKDGFSVGVPDGSKASGKGGGATFTAGSGTVAITPISAAADPVAAMTKKERAAIAAGTYPAYKRIRLAAVTPAPYPGTDVADWEYTYTRDHTATHVLARWIMVPGGTSYVLSWTAPESGWQGQAAQRDAVLASFEPIRSKVPEGS
jgi:serine/threonine protein kinase